MVGAGVGVIVVREQLLLEQDHPRPLLTCSMRPVKSKGLLSQEAFLLILATPETMCTRALTHFAGQQAEGNQIYLCLRT